MNKMMAVIGLITPLINSTLTNAQTTRYIDSQAQTLEQAPVPSPVPGSFKGRLSVEDINKVQGDAKYICPIMFKRGQTSVIDEFSIRNSYSSLETLLLSSFCTSYTYGRIDTLDDPRVRALIR